MDVTHRLSTVFTVVRDDPETLLEAELRGDLLDASEHRGQDLAVGRTRLDEARDMPARYRENVNRCLRMKVAKHDHVGILIHDVGRDLALRNPAENTRIHR